MRGRIRRFPAGPEDSGWSPGRLRLGLLICSLTLCAAGQASDHGAAPPQLADTEAAGPEQPPRKERRPNPCDEPGSTDDAWIDRFQQGVYFTVCGATNWFDSLFGNPRIEQDSDATFGRLGLFETWDDRDGFDTRLGFRARLALPAMKNRLQLTLGRGREQELVEDRPANTENPLPPSFRSVDDEAWLLGLGYSKQRGLRRGFDFGVGVRLRMPPDPYVRGTYRYNIIFDSNTMLRLRETLFWREKRGFGATTQATLDHLLTPEFLLRWNNVGTVAEDTDGLDWGSSLTLYQSLSNHRAFSYSALVRGETSAEVSLQNYGVETRYRQRLNRRWLFLELATSLTWPRETLTERRRINPGVGIGVEMYFGPVPEAMMR